MSGSQKKGRDFRWKHPDEGGSQTPSWKEAYRQRCMERLRDTRFKHLLARRQSGSVQGDGNSEETGPATAGRDSWDPRKEMMKDIQAMMVAEWRAASRDVEEDDDEENMPSPTIVEMIAMMEDILEDLRKEDCQEVSEEEVCEEYVRKEEEELCQSFHRLNAVEVVCPICQKDSLQEGPGLIHCRCGLKINTEQDSISLKNLSDNLRIGTADHEVQCEGQPSFAQVDTFGITTLVMTCQECDFHFIVV